MNYVADDDTSNDEVALLESNINFDIDDDTFIEI